MSCFPGLFGDPCVPVSDLLRGQWIAMRVITIVAAVAGLTFSLYFFIDHRKARNGFKSPMAVGTMLIVISYFSILLFYCIDPGALRAKEGGFYTPSYEAGMTTFIITASSLSATATGFVTAYWVDLANPASPKVFLEMSLVANLTWVAVAIYFLVVGVLNIAIPVNNGSLTVLEILRGLQTMGTFATALVASIAGILVLRRLDKAQEFRDFTETDLKRVQRVKIFLWCFVGKSSGLLLFSAVSQFVFSFVRQLRNYFAQAASG